VTQSGPLRVVVLAGGRSSEHEVSLASARAVEEGLLQAGHEVLSVTIAPDGAWLHDGRNLTVTPGGGLLDGHLAFPVLHGPFGEDGVVQGMLEVLDIAYVGSGVAASALCMDKVMFKELLRAKGVPQVDYAGVRQSDWRTEREAVLERLTTLGLPVFVKPAHLGSSVGIVKVTERQRLGDALDGAFTHGALAIVEAMATGAEVECAVLGYSSAESGQHPAAAFASEPGEIVLTGGEWYDYQAKYRANGMELLLPARISAQAHARVRELAVEVFTAGGCEGLARVDFFVDEERVLVNELNTMPGFTPTSVYAKLLAASRISYSELVDRLCRLALERHTERHSYRY
jgi:D-alanine-D-alanine ligase